MPLHNNADVSVGGEADYPPVCFISLRGEADLPARVTTNYAGWDSIGLRAISPCVGHADPIIYGFIVLGIDPTPSQAYCLHSCSEKWLPMA